MPVRIQRKRTRGWKTPLCTCGCGQPAIYVGRPTKWGNPFSAMECGERYPSLTAEQVAGFIVNQYEQCGNAIPPRLAAHIVASVVGISGYLDAIESYYQEAQPQAPAGARRLADICYEHARLHPAPTSDDGSNQ